MIDDNWLSELRHNNRGKPPSLEGMLMDNLFDARTKIEKLRELLRHEINARFGHEWVNCPTCREAREEVERD